MKIKLVTSRNWEYEAGFQEILTNLGVTIEIEARFRIQKSALRRVPDDMLLLTPGNSLRDGATLRHSKGILEKSLYWREFLMILCRSRAESTLDCCDARTMHADRRQSWVEHFLIPEVLIGCLHNQRD